MDPETKIETPAEAGSSPVTCCAVKWRVTYETDSGCFHTKWFYRPSGVAMTEDVVRHHAEEAMRNEGGWLVKIDAIQPDD